MILPQSSVMSVQNGFDDNLYSVILWLWAYVKDFGVVIFIGPTVVAVPFGIIGDVGEDDFLVGKAAAGLVKGLDFHFVAEGAVAAAIGKTDTRGYVRLQLFHQNTGNTFVVMTSPLWPEVPAMANVSE